MYVAVKGGEKAIEAAHRLLAEERRGDPGVSEVGLDQIREQLSLAVDRVMNEGSVYDPDLAALAVKQARGDLTEAVFLLRAYRTTLPRLGFSEPLDTERMAVKRRISATFKDLPGGQVLGPTFDYTHRLLDFDLAGEGPDGVPAEPAPEPLNGHLPRVIDILDREGLIQREKADEDREVGDITRRPLSFPAERDVRLQCLARADEGFLFGLGYSVQRGYGSSRHPFVGEIRMGRVTLEIVPEELGFPIQIGRMVVTECEMIAQFSGNKETPPQFTRGYGLTFGYCERRAMAMSLVDRALRSREMGEEPEAPAQDEEFVLSHADNVESSGFVQHLKLPHHVDFQADLVLIRRMRAEAVGEAE